MLSRAMWASAAAVGSGAMSVQWRSRSICGAGIARAGAGTVEHAVGRFPQGPRLIENACADVRPFGELRLAQPPVQVLWLGEPLDLPTWAIADCRDELQCDVA